MIYTRFQRELPPGLSKRDAKILKKIKWRAHYLDKGFRICGLRFGWTFVIGLIPVVGDVTDASINYFFVVKKAKQCEYVNFPHSIKYGKSDVMGLTGSQVG